METGRGRRPERITEKMAYINTLIDRVSQGNRVYVDTIYQTPIAYWDGGSLYPINSNWTDSGNPEFPSIVSTAPLRVLASDGGRKFLPVQDDDDAWLWLGKPKHKASGVWTQMNWNSKNVLGNRIRWLGTGDNVDSQAWLWHCGHYAKWAMRFLNGWMPEDRQVAFPYTINGLTRTGWTLYYDGDPVMWGRKPVMIDQDDTDDVREVTKELVDIGGQDHIVYTMPDVSDMSKPWLDPTWESQPNETDGTDTQIFENASGNNYGTTSKMQAGNLATGANATVRGLLAFDISSIPVGATITSATLTLYCESEADTADEDVGAHRALTQWYEGTQDNATPGAGEDASTWDERNANGSVAWAGGAGGASGSDWTASATDTTTITGDSTSFDWDVLADVQAWYGGASNYGWWLINTDETNANTSKRFTSSSGLTAANRPKLTVVYTTSGALGNMLRGMVGT